MFCTQCGSLNPDDFRFCVRCGKPRAELPASSTDASGVTAANAAAIPAAAERPSTVSKSEGDRQIEVLGQAARSNVTEEVWHNYERFREQCEAACECEGGPLGCDLVPDPNDNRYVICPRRCRPCGWMRDNLTVDFLHIYEFVHEYLSWYEDGRVLFKYRELLADMEAAEALALFFRNKFDEESAADALAKKVAERSPGLMKFLDRKLYDRKYAWGVRGFIQKDRDEVQRLVEEGGMPPDEGVALLPILRMQRRIHGDRSDDIVESMFAKERERYGLAAVDAGAPNHAPNGQEVSAAALKQACLAAARDYVRRGRTGIPSDGLNLALVGSDLVGYRFTVGDATVLTSVSDDATRAFLSAESEGAAIWLTYLEMLRVTAEGWRELEIAEGAQVVIEAAFEARSLVLYNSRFTDLSNANQWREFDQAAADFCSEAEGTAALHRLRPALTAARAKMMLGQKDTARQLLQTVQSLAVEARGLGHAYTAMDDHLLTEFIEGLSQTAKVMESRL